MNNKFIYILIILNKKYYFNEEKIININKIKTLYFILLIYYFLFI